MRTPHVFPRCGAASDFGSSKNRRCLFVWELERVAVEGAISGDGRIISEVVSSTGRPTQSYGWGYQLEVRDAVLSRLLDSCRVRLPASNEIDTEVLNSCLLLREPFRSIFSPLLYQ
jgi:hypothetical protein